MKKQWTKTNNRRLLRYRTAPGMPDCVGRVARYECAECEKPIETSRGYIQEFRKGGQGFVYNAHAYCDTDCAISHIKSEYRASCMSTNEEAEWPELNFFYDVPGPVPFHLSN